MSAPLLQGKRILVTGIADAGSIAHATAARAHELGATVVTILQVDGGHHAVA